MKRLIFLLACPVAAQFIAPVPSPLSIVSYCGSRPDVGIDSGQGTFVFDSGYTLRCNFRTKASQPRQLLWDVYVTNGNIPSDHQDNGVSKQDVTQPARISQGGPIPDDASCGNPIVSPDGTKILFECQAAANVGQDVDPGTGAPGYVLYGCGSIPCTNANAAIIYSQSVVRALCTATPAACGTVAGYDWTTMTMQGGLDPHFYPWDQNTAYWSVVESSGSATAWGTIPQFWAEHVFTIDWSAAPGGPPALSGTVTRMIPGDWTGFAGSLATKCTRYYKASSVSKAPDGTITMYTQSDQVPGLASTDGAANGCLGTNCGDQCYGINATYRQSGLFSFTLDNAPVGSHWTQLAPTASQTPHIINGEYWPYFEFPLLLYGVDPSALNPYSTKMIAISNSLSNQFGLLHDENESNKHDDYYVLDIGTGNLTLITAGDVLGSAWHAAIAEGGLAAMAHAGYNPFGRFMVTRLVSVGIPDRVLKVHLDYVGNGALSALYSTGKVQSSGKVSQ